jgi:hypothetical protein
MNPTTWYGGMGHHRIIPTVNFTWTAQNIKHHFKAGIHMNVKTVNVHFSDKIRGGRGERRMIEGVNSTMIHCKNLYKYHNVQTF